MNKTSPKSLLNLSVMPRRGQTRQKLVDAAHALIWANSYVSVSVDEICREAGVQKGSFYHFFPTKHDLAAAALEDHWATIQPEMDAIFDGDKTPQEQLRALAHAIYAKEESALIATGHVCGCPYASVGAEMSGKSERLRALSEQMGQRFCAYFEKLLTHAAEAGLIPFKGLSARAREMHIYVLGAMLEARITNRLDSVGPALEIALFRLSGIPRTRLTRTKAARKTQLSV